MMQKHMSTGNFGELLVARRERCLIKASGDCSNCWSRHHGLAEYLSPISQTATSHRASKQQPA